MAYEIKDATDRWFVFILLYKFCLCHMNTRTQVHDFPFSAFSSSLERCPMSADAPAAILINHLASSHFTSC